MLYTICFSEAKDDYGVYRGSTLIFRGTFAEVISFKREWAR